MVSEVTQNQATVRNAVSSARSLQTGVPKVAPEARVQEPAPREASAEELNSVVQKLSEFTQSVSRNLSFQVDNSTGRTVITVSDPETDQVLRQIPSEEFLELAQDLEELQGKLLKTSV